MKDISDFLEGGLWYPHIQGDHQQHHGKVWPEIKSWRTCPLEAVYPIVWMDVIHRKVHDDKRRHLHVRFTMYLTRL